MSNSNSTSPPRDVPSPPNSATDADAARAELVAAVDEMLNQLTTKFSSVSSELLAKMDDMSRRLDNLESTIQGGETTKGSGTAK